VHGDRQRLTDPLLIKRTDRNGFISLNRPCWLTSRNSPPFRTLLLSVCLIGWLASAQGSLYCLTFNSFLVTVTFSCSWAKTVEKGQYSSTQGGIRPIDKRWWGAEKEEENERSRTAERIAQLDIDGLLFQWYKLVFINHGSSSEYNMKRCSFTWKHIKNKSYPHCWSIQNPFNVLFKQGLKDSSHFVIAGLLGQSISTSAALGCSRSVRHRRPFSSLGWQRHNYGMFQSHLSHPWL